MNLNSEERIAYRFTREEVAALMRVMGLSELAGLELRAELPREETSASLVESGVVMLCGERTFVDRAISLVLSEAARSRRSLCARREDRWVALYRGERMCVNVAVEGELVTIEPLPDFERAKLGFAQMLGDSDRELEMTLSADGALESARGGAQALEALMRKLEDA